MASPQAPESHPRLGPHHRTCIDEVTFEIRMDFHIQYIDIVLHTRTETLYARPIWPGKTTRTLHTLRKIQ